MHYRFLVTFNKEHVATSTEARDYAAQYLNDNGFVYNETTRRSGWLADWYVIGGRWSGTLSRHSWAQSITFAMASIEHEKGIQVSGVYYSDKGKQRLQQELAVQFQEIWDHNAPTAYQGIPIQRDTYKGEGYEDDAMLLTQALYDALLKAYEGRSDSEYHADLEYEAVSPAMIGKKWLVVVDYHT